jgi:hypothetical protein
MLSSLDRMVVYQSLYASSGKAPSVSLPRKAHIALPKWVVTALRLFASSSLYALLVSRFSLSVTTRSSTTALCNPVTWSARTCISWDNSAILLSPNISSRLSRFPAISHIIWEAKESVNHNKSGARGVNRKREEPPRRGRPDPMRSRYHTREVSTSMAISLSGI